MEIRTLDGIDIDCLPDNAVCYASSGYVSPEKLAECPTGCKVCYPEGCINYDEVNIEERQAAERGQQDENRRNMMGKAGRKLAHS